MSMAGWQMVEGELGLCGSDQGARASSFGLVHDHGRAGVPGFGCRGQMRG
jgi:hypothetical protein